MPLSHSGGTKEPGHFEVRTSLIQVTRMQFWRPFLLSKQNKWSGQRSDMVKFLFSVHTVTKAKQSN